MFVDTNEIPDGQDIEFDLCIVGAGPAGITLARELRGQGLRIALLESGATTFTAETQELASGKNEGAPYFPLEACRLRFWGGTSNHWNGACWPLEPIDFEAREAVPGSGWPFSRTDLDPYYERAQPILQLGPFDYRPEFGATEDVDPPLLEDSLRVRNKLMQNSPPIIFPPAPSRGNLFVSPLLATHIGPP